MKRTIDIMTAARAKGVELPKGWWRVIGARSASPSEFYIGPDLERAENIYHAFTVADALLGITSLSGPWADGFVLKDVFGTRLSTAPERHLALIAACEAALGIECGEVGV